MKKYIGLGILYCLFIGVIVGYFATIAIEHGLSAAIKVFVGVAGFIGLLTLGLKLYIDGDSR